MKKQPMLARVPELKGQQQNDPQSVVRVEAVPSSPLSIGVLVLATLAVVYALYVGKEVVLPIVLAVVLKLMLQPVMNVLCDKLRIHQAVAALFLIVCLFGVVAGVAFTISGPASGWIQKIPKVLPDLKQKLQVLQRPIDYLQEAFNEVENMATSARQPPSASTVAVKEGAGMASTLAFGTVAMLSRFLATMVVLFFC
jgi:predicted PurR-regulated permease PerM